MHEGKTPPREVVVQAPNADMTLAAVVRTAMENVSWGRARDLIRSGRVELDGRTIDDDAVRVPVGATVRIKPSAPRSSEGVLDRAAVIHLDEDVIVVRKRAGVITVPFSEGDRDTLADRVRALLLRIEKRASRPARDAMVGVVQRLDKDTSGVLVFARTLTAKRHLEEQLRVHSVLRRYLAIVHGVPTSARHETFLVQDRGDGLRGSWGRTRSHRGAPPSSAKRAVTRVEVLETLGRGDASLVECRLETGRQHQIRIHLSEAGHPLVGEPVYVRGFTRPRIDAPRLMLHATTLGFVHPRTGKNVRFDDPPPHDFEDCLNSLRKT